VSPLIWPYRSWLRLAVSYIRFCEQEIIRVDIFLYIEHSNRNLLTDKCCRSVKKWTWFIFVVLLLLKTCGSSNVRTTSFYSFEPQRPHLLTHVFTLFGRVQVIFSGKAFCLSLVQWTNRILCCWKFPSSNIMLICKRSLWISQVYRHFIHEHSLFYGIMLFHMHRFLPAVE